MSQQYYQAVQANFDKIKRMFGKDIPATPLGLDRVKFEISGVEFVLSHDQVIALYLQFKEPVIIMYNQGYSDGYDQGFWVDGMEQWR